MAKTVNKDFPVAGNHARNPLLMEYEWLVGLGTHCGKAQPD